MSSTFQYPAVVSRTLDPSGRSFLQIVGLHDRRLLDCEINLIQQIQDLKRRTTLGDTTCSGVLTYAPFVFNQATAQTFEIPAFDALVNNEIITVGGSRSTDLTKNFVLLPPPPSTSSATMAAVYVCFLEMWYQRMDPISGTGFYVDSTTGLRYVSINGCVNPVFANLVPDDSIDPFSGTETTERVQLQWGIRVQPVALSYDFTKYDFGLDPGAIAAETVYGQGNQATPSSTSPYQFTKMAAVNGDGGLWRAGDGTQNDLGSMDGYTYAIPLAVVFQRNTGVFSVDQNPFGSASPSVPVSGLLSSGVSGRYDGYFADAVYHTDVVDTRSIVTLKGWQDSSLLKRGFVDLISGTTMQAIGRGQIPGSQAIALGSQLAYNIAVSATAVSNTDTVGSFDGFMNGFSSQSRTFNTTKLVTVNQKTVGVVGGRWQQNDAFTIALPGGSLATIASVQVQGIVSNTVSSTKTPVQFLPGQVTITGLGSSALTVSFAKNLVGTSYDPGLNPIYLTIGVDYPVATGLDLHRVPSNVFGGSLYDGASGVTMPIYGVSEYAVQAGLPISTALSAIAINPEYSNTIFGTRVTVGVAGSTGSAVIRSSGSTVTTFTLTRANLNGSWTGIFVLSAIDSVTGSSYPISARSITGTSALVSVAGAVPGTSTVLITLLVMNTAQLAYNAPVKGVTSIEETVLAGNVTNPAYRMDGRVMVVQATNNPGTSSNTVVLVATDSIMSGIAGDDVNKLIWVQDTLGNMNAVTISSATFSNGFVTLTVPSSVNLAVQPFFVVLALRPALAPSSTLLLTEYYVPYQGEGKALRDYDILHTEDFALVTTNGTGAAPVPGLSDVFPYNREIPIITTLPSQAVWNDSGLSNTPVASFFDSNYVAKRFQNVEHTFEVPVHTNDFIEPVNDDKRKTFQLSTPGGGRGFAKVIPHLGFAITPVTSRIVLGDNVTMTSGPATLYVDNVLGSDANSGLTVGTALKTFAAALNSLPSVLRHPCTIQLVPNTVPYSISSNSQTLEVMAFGDGVIRPLKYYALGNIAFTIQDAGRLVITALAGVTAPVTIDATGFLGFGDGPTSAFFIDSTRVLFNNIQFKGFTDPAIKAIDSNVELVNCVFTDNLTAGSFEQGCSVILDGGEIDLTGGGTGMLLSQSALESSQIQLTVDAGAVAGIFFFAELNSSIVLQTHSPAQETNISATTMIAKAELNSSISTASDFISQGAAGLGANSVLSQTPPATPFSGGVTITDVSSSIITNLNS
jgi:hypothetical protein